MLGSCSGEVEKVEQNIMIILSVAWQPDQLIDLRERHSDKLDFPPTETSPIGEERGETAVLAGYFGDSKQRNCIAIPLTHLSCPFCCQIFNTAFLRTVSTFRKKSLFSQAIARVVQLFVHHATVAIIHGLNPLTR